MQKYNLSKHASFYTVGISYKKADAELRGKFSLEEKQNDALILEAKEEGAEGLMTIATCNRTEIYGFAQHPFQLIKLLCKHTKGSVEEFQEVGYVYKNYDAIAHLFKVGTGLDSQILGDFEIIGQIKQGFYRSKSHKTINPFIERLCNSVLQASKRIKTETELSSGAASVAFASVKYLLNHVPDISKKNILLFGTGKIGRNTCKNLIKHTGHNQITLINRTREKAEKFGDKLKLNVKDYGDLQTEIRKCDVLIVATGAHLPTISKALVHHKNPLWVLDLSIPKNVSDDVAELANVTLVHLDQLSQITDETLTKRREQIPLAENIIEEIKQEFLNWLETRKFAPVIKALKSKLETLKEQELDYHSKKIADFDSQQADRVSNGIIQKITKQFVNHLRTSQVDSDDSLELIQRIFELEVERQ